MKKAFCLIIFTIMVSVNTLHGFYLGCQTGIEQDNSPGADAILDSVVAAHFNHTINRIDNGTPSTTINSDGVPTGLLTKLQSKGLKTVLMDYRTNQLTDPNLWGSLSALAQSNYYRFEAEYADALPVTDGDHIKDRYWYCSNSDTYTRKGIKLITA